MSRAQAGLVAAFLVIAAVVVAALLVTRTPEMAVPSPAPLPSSPMPTVTATSTPTGSPLASPSPSPTPQGLYMSKQMGFALTLPPPWRKAGCGNSDPGAAGPTRSETFTSAPVMEEHRGHAGSSNDSVFVTVIANPQQESPMAYAQRSHPDDPKASVTFADRPAVEVRATTFSDDDLLYYVAEGDRMYLVGYWPKTSETPDLATMQRILRSFRFLTDAERQALPDPTPFPAAAPTAEALAAMLKTAFEQKDIAALERLLGPCVSEGVVPGGGSSEPRERFVAELREQLAAGVTVTVDASAVHTGNWNPPDGAYIWSKWNAFPPGGGAPQSPQPQTYEVQLIFAKAQGGFYWSGTMLVHGDL